ncbi:MAG: hypothetical protein JWM90_2161 [Thermoleophilia bacterium]|nr:hypothetical protein [Thermoleophilia bacterium]
MIMTKPLVPYLFDPNLVAEALKRRPRLARVLKEDPHKAGSAARASDALRRNDRQIYRLLRTERMADVLDAIEASIVGGFIPAVGLRSRAYDHFDSALSEVYVAADLLRRGFSITGLAETLQTDPDIVIKRDDISAIIEVTRPQQWSETGHFERGLSDLLGNVDIPFNFASNTTVDLAEQFIDGHLQYMHPAETNRAFQKAMPWLTQVQAWLEGLPTITAGLTQSHIFDNRRIVITLEPVEIPLEDALYRPGTGGGSATGWSPQHLIERVVRRADSKAKRQQAGSATGGPLRILLVDMSSSAVATEVGHDYYDQVFLEAMEKGLTHRVGPTAPYDAIALALPNLKGIHACYIIEDAGDRATHVHEILVQR